MYTYLGTYPRYVHTTYIHHRRRKSLHAPTCNEPTCTTCAASACACGCGNGLQLHRMHACVVGEAPPLMGGGLHAACTCNRVCVCVARMQHSRTGRWVGMRVCCAVRAPRSQCCVLCALRGAALTPYSCDLMMSSAFLSCIESPKSDTCTLTHRWRRGVGDEAWRGG